MMSGTSSWSRILLLFILSYTFLIPLSSAVDGSGYDYSLGITSTQYAQGQGLGKSLLFATILEYDQDTSSFLTDDHLVGLAAQAWEEMGTLHRANLARCSGNDPDRFPQIPSAISAMAIGNKVYISSSFRWRAMQNSLVYVLLEDSELTRLLNACQSELQYSNPNANVPDRHRVDATCAEVFTIQQYLNHNNNQSPKDLPAGTKKRIATWGNNGIKKGSGEAMPACNTRGSGKGGWGCEEFMQSLGIDIMSDLMNAYAIAPSKIPPRTPIRPKPLDAGLSIQLQDASSAPRVSGS